MSSYKRILAGLLVALCALALVLSPASAKGHPNQAKVKGTLSAIDTTLMTVTIQPNNGSPLTLTVNDSTRIHKDNKEWATIADLAVGDYAEARYDNATLIAKRIQAKSPKPPKPSQVEGTISAVDTGAMTVTIQPKHGDAVTLTITDATKLERNHHDAVLADFVVGDRAEAKYDPLTMIASRLEATAH